MLAVSRYCSSFGPDLWSGASRSCYEAKGSFVHIENSCVRFGKESTWTILCARVPWDACDAREDHRGVQNKRSTVALSRMVQTCFEYELQHSTQKAMRTVLYDRYSTKSSLRTIIVRVRYRCLHLSLHFFRGHENEPAWFCKPNLITGVVVQHIIDVQNRSSPISSRL